MTPPRPTASSVHREVVLSVAYEFHLCNMIDARTMFALEENANLYKTQEACACSVCASSMLQVRGVLTDLTDDKEHSMGMTLVDLCLGAQFTHFS